MVMKRSRTTRKFTRRVKRTMRRVPRPVRSTAIMSMKKLNYQGGWTFNTASTSGFWQYLTWIPTNAFQNFAEIQSLFDEFKINAIKVTFRPRFDSVDAAGAGTTPLGYLHYCVDPGSTVIPSGTYTAATLNGFLENSGVKTRTLNRPVSIYFRPKVQDQLLGGSTASRVIRSPWCKTNNASIDFRGVHAFVQLNNMAATNASLVLDQFVTVYMQVRNLR